MSKNILTLFDVFCPARKMSKIFLTLFDDFDVAPFRRPLLRSPEIGFKIWDLGKIWGTLGFGVPTLGLLIPPLIAKGRRCDQHFPGQFQVQVCLVTERAISWQVHLSLVLKAFGPLISLMSWEWTNRNAANLHLELPGFLALVASPPLLLPSKSAALPPPLPKRRAHSPIFPTEGGTQWNFGVGNYPRFFTLLGIVTRK